MSKFDRISRCYRFLKAKVPRDPRPPAKSLLRMAWAAPIVGLVLFNFAPQLAAQTPEDGFDPDPSSTIHTVVEQADGGFVLGGGFILVAGTLRNFIARVAADGALDPGFNPDANDTVFALAEQLDGKLLVGGAFTSIAGASHNAIVRLNPDGTADVAFIAGADGAVRAIALQSDGKVVIAGGFGMVNGVARNRIARLHSDGSLDATFDPGAGTNNTVNALAVQGDGKILLGGLFTQVNGAARNHLARLNGDGSLDPGYDPDAGSHVHALAVQADGKALVGGGFSQMSGISRNRLARLHGDGTLDGSYNNIFGPDDSVYAIRVQRDGKAVIVGDFTTFNGTPRKRIARINRDGTLDGSLNPGVGADGRVNALVIQDTGGIVLGGSFFTVGGASRNALARIHGDGTTDQDFNPGANGIVLSLAVQTDGKIFAAGTFSTFNGLGRARLARTRPDGQDDIGFSPAAGADNSVHAVALTSTGGVYIGGSFTQFNGQARARIARLFSSGGVDGTFDPGSGANDAVNTLIEQADGKLLIGGVFTTVQGAARSRLARLNSDGSLDAGFDPSPSSTVSTLALQADGMIIVGGSFTSIGGGSRSSIARLHADGTLDGTFNAMAIGPVHAIVVQPDGNILVGGEFTSIGGAARNRIARLLPSGMIDPTFNPGSGAGAAVRAIALQTDGDLIIAGDFGFVNSEIHNRLARLRADGSVDSSFTLSADSVPRALAIQADGKLLLGGQFTAISGIGRNRIARLSQARTGRQQLVLEGTTARWLRSGALPELASPPLLSLSPDGISYSTVGTMSRIAGGWSLAALPLPPGGGAFHLRAEGRFSSGSGNSAGSRVDSVALFELPMVDTVFASGFE